MYCFTVAVDDSSGRCCGDATGKGNVQLLPCLLHSLYPSFFCFQTRQPAAARNNVPSCPSPPPPSVAISVVKSKIQKEIQTTHSLLLLSITDFATILRKPSFLTQRLCETANSIPVDCVSCNAPGTLLVGRRVRVNFKNLWAGFKAASDSCACWSGSFWGRCRRMVIMHSCFVFDASSRGPQPDDALRLLCKAMLLGRE